MIRSVLFAAITLCLCSILLAIVASIEHRAGRKPAWLWLMSVVLSFAGLAVGGVYFWAM